MTIFTFFFAFVESLKHHGTSADEVKDNILQFKEHKILEKTSFFLLFLWVFFFCGFFKFYMLVDFEAKFCCPTFKDIYIYVYGLYYFL